MTPDEFRAAMAHVADWPGVAESIDEACIVIKDANERLKKGNVCSYETNQ